MIVIPQLGLFALLLLIAATTHWFFRTWQVNIPKNSIAYKIAWLTGLLMGCFAYYQSSSDPFAPWAIGVGTMMVYLVFTEQVGYPPDHPGSHLAAALDGL